MNLVMTKTRGCYFPRRRRRDNKTRKRSCWVFIMVPVLPQYFSVIFHNSVSSSIFLVVTIVIFLNVASSKNPFKTTWSHLHFFSCSRNATYCIESARKILLREKISNTEFILVQIFPYLDWTRRFTEQISVFSPAGGKYGPEKTPYLDTFGAVSWA